jgi:hypothetical protein
VAGSASVASAGLILLGLAEVPQVMSAFLPSPTTAYMGGADPVRVMWLRRGEIIGSAVSLSIAAAVSLVASGDMGGAAGLIFLGAVVILGLFLWEYERAIKKGQTENGGKAQGQGY